jgi:hypothetical protein
VGIGLYSWVQANQFAVLANFVDPMRMVVDNRDMLLVCVGLVECMLSMLGKGFVGYCGYRGYLEWATWFGWMYVETSVERKGCGWELSEWCWLGST